MILPLIILYVVTLVYLSITERFRNFASLIGLQGWLLFAIALVRLHAINPAELTFICLETLLFIGSQEAGAAAPRHAHGLLGGRHDGVFDRGDPVDLDRQRVGPGEVARVEDEEHRTLQKGGVALGRHRVGRAGRNGGLDRSGVRGEERQFVARSLGDETLEGEGCQQGRGRHLRAAGQEGAFGRRRRSAVRVL